MNENCEGNRKCRIKIMSEMKCCIFAHNLRTIRKALGLSQEEISSECNLSLKTYVQVEQGRVMPKFDTVMMIAEILDVDIHKMTSCFVK